jgi:hypothetical protein
VLIVVIVTICISLTLFGLWAKDIVHQHRRSTNQEYRLQASALAEAGLRRAMARRAADAEFREETWLVSGEHLGRRQAATVHIRIAPGEDGAIRCEATAQFPADAVRRAQVTKRTEVAAPSIGQ